MNFEEKKRLVGEFFENNTIIERRTKAERETKTPTKFFVVIRDGELKCVWSRNVRYKKIKGKRICTDKLLQEIRSPVIGYESDEWTQITKDFINLESRQAMQGISLPWPKQLQVRETI